MVHDFRVVSMEFRSYGGWPGRGQPPKEVKRQIRMKALPGGAFGKQADGVIEVSISGPEAEQFQLGDMVTVEFTKDSKKAPRCKGGKG